MTVLFSDLVGSTQLLDGRDPEDALEILDGYRMAVRSAIERLGGFVLLHAGDGVVVCFGYPIGAEDAAERAVRAGLAIIEAVGRLTAVEKPLQVRIGIATGVVVSHANPATDRIEDAFTGAALNIASRLQNLAEPGRIVVAQSTQRLISGAFETRALGPQRLRGFTEPIEAFAVVGMRQARTRFEQRVEANRAPLINRYAERDLLKRLFGEAAGGSPRALLIEGEPGIGKSRLAHVLGETADGLDFQQLGLQCNAALSNTVLHPHIDLLERQCGIAPSDDEGERLEKLRAFVEARRRPTRRRQPCWRACLRSTRSTPRLC